METDSQCPSGFDWGVGVHCWWLNTYVTTEMLRVMRKICIIKFNSGQPCGLMV